MTSLGSGARCISQLEIVSYHLGLIILDEFDSIEMFLIGLHYFAHAASLKQSS